MYSPIDETEPIKIMIDLEMRNKQLSRSHFAGHVDINKELLTPGRHNLNYTYLNYNDKVISRLIVSRD